MPSTMIGRDAISVLGMGQESLKDPHRLKVLLEAQESLIVEDLGVLCLNPELQFVFCYLQSPETDLARRPVGVLAWRHEGIGAIWVQIAYTVEPYRRRGVFASMVRHLEIAHSGKRIGFGVRNSNMPMCRALEKLGYADPARCFYKLITK